MAVALAMPPQQPFMPSPLQGQATWGQQHVRLTPEAWQALLSRTNTSSASSSTAPVAAAQPRTDGDQRRGALRLEYCDGSASSGWHPCQVLSVTPSGDMQVSINQGLWLTLADQATKLRLAHPSMSQGLAAATAALGDAAPARPKSDQDPWQAPPWADRASQGPRRQLLGLDDLQVKAFTRECEFVSLGCYCGTAFALQTIGLKSFSYPFDWLRSPIEGVIQLLDSGFQNFLTYSTQVDKGAHGMLYGETRWGGSFWHHNPADAKVLQEFGRRVDRLTGQRSTDVAMAKTRVFVRVANSTSELGNTLRLHKALQRIVPSRCLLLVLIDMQKEAKVFQVDGTRDLLFCTVQDSVFQEPGVHWKVQMQFGSEAYAYAIARALRHWALGPNAQPVEKVVSLAALEAACLSYDGGNAASELYVPKRIEGLRARGVSQIPQHVQALAAPAQLAPALVAPAPSMSPPVVGANAVPAPSVAFHRQLSPGPRGGARAPMPEVVTWSMPEVVTRSIPDVASRSMPEVVTRTGLSVALGTAPLPQTHQPLMVELPRTMPDLRRVQQPHQQVRRLVTSGVSTPTMPPPTRLVTHDSALLKAGSSPPVVRTCTSPPRTYQSQGKESPCVPPPTFLRGAQRQQSTARLDKESQGPQATSSPIASTRAAIPRPQ